MKERSTIIEQRTAQRLIQLRKNAGLNQAEVARKLKMSSKLSNYETGVRYPSEKDVELLADFYGVSMDYILGIAELEETLTFQERIAKIFEMFYGGSCAEFGRKNGLGHDYIGQLRRGYRTIKDMSPETIKKLSNGLGFSDCYLIEGKTLTQILKEVQNG